MKRSSMFLTATAIILSFLAVMGGCSGDGKGGIFGGGTGTTVISGKVTLSSSIVGVGKPSLSGQSVLDEAAALRKTVPGMADRPGYTTSLDLKKTLSAMSMATALANGQVDMYDSDHPEWLFPVASGTTDANGDYTLSSMANASKNTGASYADGDPIPAGNYTLVAYSGFGLGQKPVVAVQSIVKNFDGTISNVDFEVLPSDVSPEVIYMFGTRKLSDGTERWGFDENAVTATLPANSAIQLSFSLPMWRDSMNAGIVISPAVAGKWSLSADWLTATYYLDQGVQMVPGQEYTVTIYGEDSDPSVPRALNVYGNALKKTAVGKFTATAADTIGPTIQWNSPTVIEMGGTVDVTQTFRIESNKPLDVNGISLRGSPSIGVKPGVLFLGRNKAGLFVYEFVLGEPLKLDTSYSLAVSGGKDLAGQRINTLTGSISTKDAANTPGIDPNAAADIQNLQAQVKAVFGKWVRAMNDRNIAQWQSVMSGEFYLEYDVNTIGIDGTVDTNRDGRYSLGEFSRMLVTEAFPQWEYCGSAIAGLITPTPGDYINVVPLTNEADFEFKLTAATDVGLSRCLDSAPRESFFLTLKFKNGSWKIVRGSIGIDNRTKTIDKPNLINGKLYEVIFPFGPFESLWRTEVVDGGIMRAIPDNMNLMAKYSWESTTGVQTYILVVTDERNPFNGFAFAFPSTVTSFRSDQDPILDLKGIEVSGKLGFDTFSNFVYQVGGRYYWEVIGLGTTTAVPDPANPNDQTFVGNKTPKDILADISAVSTIRRYTIAGVFAELQLEVRAGVNMAVPPVVYNPAIFGYDLGSAFQTTLTIYTPNVDVPTARVTQTGGARKTFDVTFTNRQASVSVPLYRGINSFFITETGVPAGRAPLFKSFWVLTLGGKQRPIQIWEVTDDLGNTLSGDEWNYYKAPGASKINVLGAVSDPLFTDLDVFVFNSEGQYFIQTRATVTTTGSGDNTFTTDTMSPPGIEIYKGNNRISFQKSIFSGGTSTFYRSNFYVYTDTGSVYVPPISNVTIVNAGSTVATKDADYGTSSDWSVVIDPTRNFTVQVAGKFKNLATGRYYVYSDGGYANGNITPDALGNFSFDALLYNGWNQVSIYDASNNGYWMSINTTTGKPFIKPTITRIDGFAYDPAASQNRYTDSNCTAMIEGTAEAGQMYVYWSGTDVTGTGYFEYQNIQNTDGTFRFAVPLVGPGGSNIVDINDYQGRWTSVTITTTGACSYSPPSFSITEVRDAGGSLLPPSGNQYFAGTSATVTVSGTSNREGAQIFLRHWQCGQEETYKAFTAADGSWSITGIKVYGLSYANDWSYLDISMSNNYQSIMVNSTNTSSPVRRMNLTSVTGNAGPIVPDTGSVSACGDPTWWLAGGSNTTVTISGTSTVQNGTLYFRDTLNQQGQVPIVNGTFTLANVPLFNAPDNYINFYNTNDPAGYSSLTLYIASTNGVPKPRFVTVTSPVIGTDNITGTLAVSGTISDPIGSGFSGANGRILGQVYSYACGYWSYFTNDTWMQANYGYGNANMTATTFDFSAALCGITPDTVIVYVDVYDYNTGSSHYHEVYYNDGAVTPTERWSKPGSAAAKDEGRRMLRGLEAGAKAFQVKPK